MTNKRFDWMTPEEAFDEIEQFEPCFYLQTNGERTVCVKLQQGHFLILAFTTYTPSSLIFDTRNGDETRKCICRAIVPEVPGE